MKNILVLGGTTYDQIISLETLPVPKPQTIHYAPYHETLGSTGAGKALNLTKLGVNTRLHSILGEDEYGQKIIDKLVEEGVAFTYDIDPAGTERHVNLMSQNGERISIFITQSSSDLSLDMKRMERLIEQADLVVLNILAYTKQLIPLLKKAGKPIWTDLHDYNPGNPYHEDYIESANVIFVSSDNMSNYRPQMEEWIANGKEFVVCTHGKNGATLVDKNGEWMEIPIVEGYKFQDANGAGDSFFAGFLYGALKGAQHEGCLKYATICAGLCITSSELAFESLSAELLEEEFEKYFGEKY